MVLADIWRYENHITQILHHHVCYRIYALRALGQFAYFDFSQLCVYLPCQLFAR